MPPLHYTPITHLINTNVSSGMSNVEKHEEGSTYPQESAVLEEIVEHTMSPDVAPHIEERQDTIAQSSVLNVVGAVSTGNSSFKTTKPIIFPIPDETIMRGSKESLDASIRWLAERCLFYLKKAHYHLKIIHGKIIRVSSAHS